MSDKSAKEIRGIIEQWAESTRYDRKDDILANHLPDCVIFDVLEPMQYRGTESYRKSFDAWQPPFRIPSLFELSELTIEAGSDLGFAHCLIHCGGTLPDGKEVRDTVRASFCFSKTGGAWKFRHHHISMPVKID
jgi:ketosteroid isomerase-like protein